jgi:hypothetical protein
MPVSICDVTFYLQITSLVLSVIALLLAWFDEQKPSIMVMAFAVICQAIVTFRPACATIFDPRGVPIVGHPQGH